MSNPVEATVTGTASQDPWVLGVRAVASRISFDRNRLAAGASAVVLETIQLYKSSSEFGVDILVLSVGPEAGLTQAESAKQVKARIASLRKAIVATGLITAAEYRIGRARP